MDDDLKKIRKLTQFMRKQGLLHLKQGDIELSLSPQAIQTADDTPSTESVSEEALKPKYSDQDVLMWSVPGYQPGIEAVGA